MPAPFTALGDVRALPAATPANEFPHGPMDRRGARGTTGVIVHPRVLVPVFDRPGGAAFASLPNTLLGYETWLPVVGYQTGWVKVLLPSRPGGVSGWLDSDQVISALTSVEIRIYLRAGRLHLVREGHIAGSGASRPAAHAALFLPVARSCSPCVTTRAPMTTFRCCHSRSRSWIHGRAPAARPS